MSHEFDCYSTPHNYTMVVYMFEEGGYPTVYDKSEIFTPCKRMILAQNHDILTTNMLASTLVCANMSLEA